MGLKRNTNVYLYSVKIEMFSCIVEDFQTDVKVSNYFKTKA